MISMTRESSQDAITKEEIEGTAPPSKSTASSASSNVRNAFTTLMSPKRKSSPSTSPSLERRRKSKPPFASRDGLGRYVLHPESYPASQVIYHNPTFVAIHDLYPKSSVHTLLLPRSSAHNLLHPFDAFEDTEFLAECKAEAEKLRKIVAKELQRRYGRFSKGDGERNKILNGEVEPPSDGLLPEGRDWEKEVMVGIHACPSMNHLHIHVLSKDRVSECMRHRKHYNSFATGFFVPLDAFPLAEDDERRHPGREGYLAMGFVCWRCGKGFGNQFKLLKEHLEVEFEEWKKE
ncbi:HIT domain-containing protein [Halenospora varia]|nr:HIT domain-containing protein [Halenospora varia]